MQGTLLAEVETEISKIKTNIIMSPTNKVGRDCKVCDKLFSIAKNQLHAVWLFT